MDQFSSNALRPHTPHENVPMLPALIHIGQRLDAALETMADRLGIVRMTADRTFGACPTADQGEGPASVPDGVIDEIGRKLDRLDMLVTELDAEAARLTRLA